MSDSIYISVTSLNKLIKDKFDADPGFNNVFLRGEISNFKRYPSGHLYFVVKDDQSLIKAVMWASYVPRLAFMPKDGDEVVLHGKVTCYPARGEYQIYVDAMALNGAGEQLRKLKELTEKLKNEGLFDESRKRKLRKFPLKVGLITAKGSAAIEDMKVNLLNRWPLIEIAEFPSLVQGAEAPKCLLEAFNKSQNEDIDVLIIGRGGGSSEDLSAFNDETLVRALATSKCPTISAVGHEIDVTLTDLVADLRVSTPTGAAVAAVPDKNEVIEDLEYLFDKIVNNLESKISQYRSKLDIFSKNAFLLDPSSIYKDKIEKIEQVFQRIDIQTINKMATYNLKLKGCIDRLNALSPNNVVNRGYSITTDEKGNIVKDIGQIEIGSVVKTKLKNGIITSRVDGKEKSNE